MGGVDDIWEPGCFDVVAAAEYLSVSQSYLRAIAKQCGWQRKYLGSKVVYPKSSVVAYLAALPSEPPAELKSRVARIGGTIGAK